MPTTLPKVSIGIPTFNRAAYVVRAIEGALAQTYPSIEIIVSDNASTDSTEEAVAAFTDARVTVIRQLHNIGMTGNFNACLQHATGEFFLMLSDDDMLDPRCIEELMAPFLEGDAARVGVSWSPVHILDPAGKQRYDTSPGPARESGLDLVEGLFRGTRGPRLCSVLVRRADALNRAYRDEHGPICDVGNWGQIALSYPIAACFSQAVSGYTVHPGSISSVPDGALWQRSGVAVSLTLEALLRERHDSSGALRVHRAASANISNLLATVMMQRMGRPGWLAYWLSEAARAPRYLFAPVVFRRLLKDGWKLLRVRKSFTPR